MVPGSSNPQDDTIRRQDQMLMQLAGAYRTAEKYAQANGAFKGLFRRLREQLSKDVLKYVDQDSSIAKEW